MIDLAVFLKRHGYRPDQVQDFIPAPMDVAAAMYYTGIDPFTRQPVYVARHLRDRKLQRALMQFFKPENYFEVRQALRQAGRQELIGDQCDCSDSFTSARRGDSAPATGRQCPFPRPICPRNAVEPSSEQSTASAPAVPANKGTSGYRPGPTGEKPPKGRRLIACRPGRRQRMSVAAGRSSRPRLVERLYAAPQCINRFAPPVARPACQTSTPGVTDDIILAVAGLASDSPSSGC